MLGKLVQFIRSGDASSVPQDPLLARVIHILGPEIAEADGFSKRLLPAIKSAQAFFESQAAVIPGPFEVSEARYIEAPELTKMFREQADIGHALGRSLAVKESLNALRQEGHAELHALLGMRIKPGSQVGESGEVIFADHVLHSLAASPAATRESLCLAAFERILKNFAEHVEKLRRRQRLSKLEWEWNLQHDVARTVDAAHPGFVYADQELTPEKLLQGLISWLASPANFFHLKSGEIRLPTPTADKNGTMPLLHCSDRRQWLVCFVRFSAEEAERALQRETHNHRYIFI